MRIAVIGAGGIGGIYGAALAQAGADVTFVARGAHLAAMRENGLRIEGDRGETHIQPAQATADIAGIGVVDYVLLCVKLWDVESAGEQICPIVGPTNLGRPIAEWDGRRRSADTDSRARSGDGRQCLRYRLDRRARRHPPDGHLSPDDLRRTRRQRQRSRRAPARSVRVGRNSTAC